MTLKLAKNWRVWGIDNNVFMGDLSTLSLSFAWKLRTFPHLCIHVQHYWQLLRILLCFLHVREPCQKWNHVYQVSLNTLPKVQSSQHRFLCWKVALRLRIGWFNIHHMFGNTRIDTHQSCEMLLVTSCESGSHTESQCRLA